MRRQKAAPLRVSVTGLLFVLALLLGLVVPAAAFGAVTRFEQDHPSVSYTPVWNVNVPGVGLSHGTYSWTNAGGSATFTFTGTGVDWIGRRQQWFGIAEVSLDSGPWQAVNLYSPDDFLTGVVWSASGLSNQGHTLTIRWTGRQDPASTEGVYGGGLPPYNVAALVGIDAFDVYTPDGVPVTVDIGGAYGDTMFDTYLYSYRPTGYFGNSTANFAGSTAVGEERTVISIPLAKLADVTPQQAILDLTKSNGTLFPLRVYRLRPTLGRATWNEFAAGSAWGAGGAKDAALDYFAVPFAASSGDDFDVTALLQAALAEGESTLDLIVVDPAPVLGRYAGFYAADCVHPAYRPCLEVEGFEVP